MVQGLTDKQRTVLEAVQRYWDERGVAPSLGDLGAVLGLRRSTVHQHVLALKRKGYLEHIEGYARSWKPVGQLPMPGSRRVPVLGRVAAGLPVLAQQNIEDWITVDDAPAGSTLFALRVRGQSMIGVGIIDGDLVVVDDPNDTQVAYELRCRRHWLTGDSGPDGPAVALHGPTRTVTTSTG